MSETPVETPLPSGESAPPPQGGTYRAPGRAREGHDSPSRGRGVGFARLRAVAVGDQPSPWSEPLPTPAQARRYVAEGDWVAPDAFSWRRAASRYLWVPLFATGVAHVIVWVGLLPVAGFDGWPAVRSASPPPLSDLLRQAGTRGLPGRLYVGGLLCLVTPFYVLAAVLARPGRLAAAVLLAAPLAAAFVV